MKKITALIMAVLLAMLSLAACSSKTPASADPVTDPAGNVIPATDSKTDPITDPVTDPAGDINVFVNFINSSDYTKAANYYTNSIKGNYALELDAQDAIIAILEKLNEEVLDGTKTKRNAEVVLGVVDNVVNTAKISVSGYNSKVESINDSIESKAAFTAGRDLQTLENYIDAIKEYEKVIEGDSNYLAAQNAIAECETKLKTSAFSKAEQLAANKQFSEALIVLNDLLVAFPEDDEILSKISVYSLTHVRTAISDAEAAFVTADDYETALSIINAALQFYPDNADLLAKKDYYNLFRPVYLASLKVYDEGSSYSLKNEEDSLGNLHIDAFRTWSHMYDYAYRVYILNGEYNKLTFTVYGTVPSDNELASLSIRDYSKGDIDLSTYIYHNETVRCNTMPFEVEIDVTGVKMLRVWVSYGVAVSDAVLQRTAK